MMCLVEDQQIDLPHFDVAVGHSLIQDFGNTDDDLVLHEQFTPFGLVPVVGVVRATESGNLLLSETCRLVNLCKAVTLWSRLVLSTANC